MSPYRERWFGRTRDGTWPRRHDVIRRGLVPGFAWGLAAWWAEAILREGAYSWGMRLRRPTVEELEAAKGRLLPDVIGAGLRVLFVGINPSLYSAATGHHFARPGNRFWPALFRGGVTDRLLVPGEDRELLRFGCGVTNLVARASVAAAEVSEEELREGA